jgi:outer membrane protein OmpA-like peptidoglycan-associated protein
MYVIGLLLAALLATWAGFRMRDSRRWRDYVASLRNEEGIVITHEERDGSRYAISGLRDPLSRDPAQLLGEANIPAARVSFHWEPYHSLSPRFTALRAFTDSKNRLEQQVIHFDIGKSVLVTANRDSLRTIADLVRSLLKAGEGAGEHANIEIVGHTDNQGSAESNDQLGLGRATAVRSALVTLGVDGRRLDVKTVGSRQPLQVGEIGTVQAENRSVSFHVQTGSGK